MIQSIIHQGLRLFWEKDDPSGLPPVQVEKIRRILTVLDTVSNPKPLKQIPKYRLHQLTGNQKGYWSITVTRNYQIIFWFKDGDVYLVDYIEHQ